MPSMSAEAELAVDEMVRVFRTAWEDIQVQMERALLNPRAWRRRSRLTAMRRAIEEQLDRVDAQAREWIQTQLPMIYAEGATTMAATLGEPLTVWTAIHVEAVQEIATDLFDDVLAATRFVRRDVKRLIREAGKMISELTVVTDRTAAGGGRELAKLLRERGLHAVVYKDGSRHGLAEYGDMLVRTKSALAFNNGALNAGQERGVVYYEVFDGPGCGWSAHNSSDIANGKIVTEDEARSFPISHPRCRRSFGARPDLRTERQQAAAQGGQVTRDQIAAQVAADAARRRPRTPRRSRVAA